MSPIVITLLSAAGSVLAFRVLIVWSRDRAKDLKFASAQYDKATSFAMRLVADESTPESVLGFVEYFIAGSGRSSFARGFSLHMLSGAYKKARKRNKIIDDVEKLGPEATRNFAEMIGHGMLSSAAADPIFSRLYLFALITFISTTGRAGAPASPERTKTVAADLALAC